MKRFHEWTRASFTLVELLAVIAIIAILAGLTLSAFSGVMKSAARSRARAEIAAMSAALESYQADNGVYPASSGFNSTNDYTLYPATGPIYQLAASTLYTNLAAPATDTFPYTPPAAGSGIKIYMTFKSSQLGNYNTSGGNVYLKDPFGNAYGYYTTNSTVNPPINGVNQYDLWSTGGDVSGTPAGTKSWISNWGLGS